MYKKITKKIAFLIILISPGLIHAQVDVGIKGGYGFNQYYFNTNFSQVFLPVINGGLLFQYVKDRKAGIQTSVEFTQKGWDEQTIEAGSMQFKMDFVQFNFLSLFKLNKKKENGIFVKFGPYIAYSFAGDYYEKGTGNSLTFNYDSLASSYKKLDYGIRGGVSYKFAFSSGSLQLEVLYAQGLFNMLERDPANIFQTMNQSLFINLAYTFTISRNKKKEKVKNGDGK